jgi:Fanconi anemia group M protein
MDKPVEIIIDDRERNEEIVNGLEQHNVSVRFAQLPVGDYIISDRICVERKTVSDFSNSVMDLRLFDQIERLSRSFQKPILIIEGDEEISITKNAMIGAMLKVCIDSNVQILRSESGEETAYMLSRLAEREQIVDDREPRILGFKKAYTNRQWQLLILSSIPGVGPKLAKDLLAKFKTIRNVVDANIEDLISVDKIGKIKASRIHKILNMESGDEVDGSY